MNGPGLKLQQYRRGFTLIELIIVISIMAILIAIAVPVYKIHLLHAHEAVLKEDLYSMRSAIDQYTQDKNKAPQDLSDLVSAGYLHSIPKDPMTNDDKSWVLDMEEDVLDTLGQTETGLTNVHSGSTLNSTEGTAYRSW